MLNDVGSVGAKIIANKTASCVLANPQVNPPVQGEEMGKGVEVVQLLQLCLAPLPVAPIPMWVARLGLLQRKRE